MSDDDNIVSLPKRKKPPGPGRGRHGNGFVNKPAGGHQATGPGWGGPAKGEGKKPSPENFISGAEPMRRYQERLPDKIATSERALVVLADIMENSEFEGNKINAAVHLLNRIEGLPVARVVQTPHGETVEEIRAINPIEAAREYQRLIGGK